MDDNACDAALAARRLNVTHKHRYDRCRETAATRRPHSCAADGVVQACGPLTCCVRAGKIVSMAVPSDGSYGIERGLMYSFPVICQPGGSWRIVQNLSVDGFSRKMMEATEKELREERDAAAAFLNKDADALARSRL